MIGVGLRGIVLTREEVGGLLANLLVSKEPPKGATRLEDWLRANARTVGTAYASELALHYR